MNNTSAIAQRPSRHQGATRPSAARRFLGVVADPQSCRNIAYLLLGLPLGTLWICVLISGLSAGICTIAIGLLGIPLLLGLAYITRLLANVERHAASMLLGRPIAPAPLALPGRGNLWVRLRSTNEPTRRRELGYLLLRFPAGVATFTLAVAALTTPVLVAYAPFAARYSDDNPFGSSSLSRTMGDIASSGWSWLLVPIGATTLIGAFHLLNVIATWCGRWAEAWLDLGPAGSVASGNETSGLA